MMIPRSTRTIGDSNQPSFWRPPTPQRRLSGRVVWVLLIGILVGAVPLITLFVLHDPRQRTSRALVDGQPPLPQNAEPAKPSSADGDGVSVVGTHESELAPIQPEAEHGAPQWNYQSLCGNWNQATEIASLRSINTQDVQDFHREARSLELNVIDGTFRVTSVTLRTTHGNILCHDFDCSLTWQFDRAKTLRIHGAEYFDLSTGSFMELDASELLPLIQESKALELAIERRDHPALRYQFKLDGLQWPIPSPKDCWD